MSTNSLTIQNLRIGYPHKSLFHVDKLEGMSGNLIALIGRNGTGKSTLLRTLVGLTPISNINTNILFNHAQINTLSNKALSTLIGYVSTDSVKTQYLTVFNLVSLGLYNHTNIWGKLTLEQNKIVTESLKSIDIYNLKERFINELSDGERQKVMVARVIAQQTPIILLDEPTSHLDISGKNSLIKQLKELASSHNKLIIFSTHDLDLVRKYSDSVWVVHNKEITSGTFSHLQLTGVIDSITK